MSQPVNSPASNDALPDANALPPWEWTLHRADEKPAAHLNLLAHRTYRLVHPTDAAQSLWCYCDKRIGKKGKAEWANRYGMSEAAKPAVQALVSSDFYGNVLAKIFRRATRKETKNVE